MILHLHRCDRCNAAFAFTSTEHAARIAAVVRRQRPYVHEHLNDAGCGGVIEPFVITEVELDGPQGSEGFA